MAAESAASVAATFARPVRWVPMCELYLHSADTPRAHHPGFAEFIRHADAPWDNPDGWGAAFYHAVDAQLFHEPVKATKSELARFTVEHPPESRLVVAHIRAASKGGITLANTQPLSRFSHGRRVVFAHNGAVAPLRDTAQGKRLEARALGTADSEIALLKFLDWKGERRIAQCVADFPRFAREMAEAGPFNVIVSDGEDTLAHSDRRKHVSDGEGGDFRGPGLYLHRPASGAVVLTSEPMPDSWPANAAEGVPRGTTLHIRGSDIVSRTNSPTFEAAA